MNKLIATILIAGAAGVAAAWAWNKYGKNPCPCKKALSTDVKTASPGGAATNNPPPASLNSSVETPPLMAPTDNVKSFDGWRDAY